MNNHLFVGKDFYLLFDIFYPICPLISVLFLQLYILTLLRTYTIQ